MNRVTLPSTVRAMKPETAVRLASTTTDSVGVEDAKAIVREFLAQIGRCSACDDVGVLVVGRQASIEVRGPGPTSHKLSVGEVIDPCPRCGGKGSHDPDFVAWHCYVYDNVDTCRAIKENEAAEKYPQHARCGYRVLLPLPLDLFGQGS
jgi:hypothetical protein